MIVSCRRGKPARACGAADCGAARGQRGVSTWRACGSQLLGGSRATDAETHSPQSLEDATRARWAGVGGVHPNLPVPEGVTKTKEEHKRFRALASAPCSRKTCRRDEHQLGRWMGYFQAVAPAAGLQPAADIATASDLLSTQHSGIVRRSVAWPITALRRATSERASSVPALHCVRETHCGKAW